MTVVAADLQRCKGNMSRISWFPGAEKAARIEEVKDGGRRY